MKQFKSNGLEGINLVCSANDSVPIRVYRVLDNSKANGKDDLHYHLKGFEYYYVIAGEMEMRVGEQTMTLRAGELICIEPHEVHTVLAVSRQSDILVFRSEYPQDKVSIDNKQWGCNNSLGGE